MLVHEIYEYFDKLSLNNLAMIIIPILRGQSGVDVLKLFKK